MLELSVQHLINTAGYRPLLIVFMMLSLTGCGGGSGSDEKRTQVEPTRVIEPETQHQADSFVDDPERPVIDASSDTNSEMSGARADGAALHSGFRAEIVEDFNYLPSAGSSHPSRIYHVDGKAYFTATDRINGDALWETDGTSEGTMLVYDFVPGAGGAIQTPIQLREGSLLLSVSTYQSQFDNWLLSQRDGSLTKLSTTDSKIYTVKEAQDVVYFQTEARVYHLDLVSKVATELSAFNVWLSRTRGIEQTLIFGKELFALVEDVPKRTQYLVQYNAGRLDTLATFSYSDAVYGAALTVASSNSIYLTVHTEMVGENEKQLLRFAVEDASLTTLFSARELIVKGFHDGLLIFDYHASADVSPRNPIPYGSAIYSTHSLSAFNELEGTVFEFRQYDVLNDYQADFTTYYRYPELLSLFEHEGVTRAIFLAPGVLEGSDSVDAIVYKLQDNALVVDRDFPYAPGEDGKCWGLAGFIPWTFTSAVPYLRSDEHELSGVNSLCNEGGNFLEFPKGYFYRGEVQGQLLFNSMINIGTAGAEMYVSQKGEDFSPRLLKDIYDNTGTASSVTGGFIFGDRAFYRINRSFWLGDSSGQLVPFDADFVDLSPLRFWFNEQYPEGAIIAVGKSKADRRIKVLYLIDIGAREINTIHTFSDETSSRNFQLLVENGQPEFYFTEIKRNSRIVELYRSRGNARMATRIGGIKGPRGKDTSSMRQMLMAGGVVYAIYSERDDNVDQTDPKSQTDYVTIIDTDTAVFDIVETIHRSQHSTLSSLHEVNSQVILVTRQITEKTDFWHLNSDTLQHIMSLEHASLGGMSIVPSNEHLFVLQRQHSVPGILYRLDGSVNGVTQLGEVAFERLRKALDVEDSTYFQTDRGVSRYDGDKLSSLLDIDLGEEVNLHYFKGHLIFTQCQGYLFDCELWAFDAATESNSLRPFILIDVNPGSGNANPQNILVLDDVVYFIANTPEYGGELWRLTMEFAF